MRSGMSVTPQGYFWENCEKSLISYSLKIDGKTADDLAGDNAVFDCASKFYEDKNRENCQEVNGYKNLSEEAKNFYNDCQIPYENYIGSHGTILNECGPETDRCNLCLIDPTCTTFQETISTSFEKKAQNLRNQDEFIFYPTIDKCPEMMQNCPRLIIKDLAYYSCIQYFTIPCQHTFLKKYSPNDECLPYFECTDYVTANAFIQLFSVISIILFFAF